MQIKQLIEERGSRTKLKFLDESLIMVKGKLKIYMKN